MNFVIHWNETALSLHVFPIPIPPPTSISTRSLQVFPEHQFYIKESTLLEKWERFSMVCFRKSHQRKKKGKERRKHKSTRNCQLKHESWRAGRNIFKCSFWGSLHHNIRKKKCNFERSFIKGSFFKRLVNADERNLEESLGYQLFLLK